MLFQCSSYPLVIFIMAKHGKIPSEFEVSRSTAHWVLACFGKIHRFPEVCSRRCDHVQHRCWRLPGLATGSASLQLLRPWRSAGESEIVQCGHQWFSAKQDEWWENREKLLNLNEFDDLAVWQCLSSSSICFLNSHGYAHFWTCTCQLVSAF